MKSFKFMSLMLALTACTTVFTACSKDDDDNASGEFNYNLKAENLETPKYEKNSALYVINSEDSNIKSIEFTSSGDYIIVPSYNVYGAREDNRKPSIMRKAMKMMTRAYESGIIYGKYTVREDGTYVLDGYGTITVKGSTDNAISLDINPNNGEPYTLEAAKKTQLPESQLTNDICRSWSFGSFRFIFTVPALGGTLLDKEYKMNEISQLNKDMEEIAKKYASQFDDEDDDPYKEDYEDDYAEDIELGEMPEHVIFSKAGTYMVLYTDKTLAVSTWAWENESKGLLRYSWDYNDMYSGPSGNVQVGFRGNQLAFTESITERDTDYEDVELESTVTIVWFMNEVK